MTNKLFLIRGLPGSGKSTIAEKMVERSPNSVHFEADDFFCDTGKYIFVPEQLLAAHAFCQYNAFKALENGQTVVVANTFSTVSEMLPYIIFAHRHMIPVKVIKATGAFSNIHGAPEEVVKFMRERWQNYEGESEYRDPDDVFNGK